MARRLLSSRQWRHIRRLLPPQKGQGRPYTQSHRITLEGILWIARTGAPWRDLPLSFGKWNTVYKRFNRWVKSGILATVFAFLSQELDLDVLLIDGTFVKVHQHGTGAPKGAAHLTKSRLRKPWAVVRVG